MSWFDRAHHDTLGIHCHLVMLDPHHECIDATFLENRVTSAAEENKWQTFFHAVDAELLHFLFRFHIRERLGGAADAHGSLAGQWSVLLKHACSIHLRNALESINCPSFYNS